MGWVRVLLALAVVMTHAGMNFSVAGTLAVQLFYMISGFLMSYIIVEKRSYARIRDFYVSRYLRLYPVYLVTALATAAAYAIVFPAWFEKFATMPLSAALLLGISNAIILFQDVVMFTAVEGGQLVPTTDFLKSDVALFTGLLVPQAWTLSLELMFYIIAPFILPRPRLLVVLFAASIACRLWLIHIGIGFKDPWSYRFFPAELALFILGALSHQFLLPWARSVATPQVVQLSFAASLVVLVGWTFVPVREGLLLIPLFGAFAAALPFLFLFQNSSSIDQRIGELSYPLYINHMLTLNVSEFVLAKIGFLKTPIATLSFIVAPLIVAYMLNLIVANPMESWRKKLRRK